MVRCQAREAVGRPFCERVSEGFRHVLEEYTRRAEPTLWFPEGLSAVRADGEVFPVEATVSRVEEGSHVLYTVFLRDINERRKAEAECARLHGIALYLEQEVRAARQFEDIVGNSAVLTKVMRGVERVAATDSTVLIVGETGTGKELIARAVHQWSPRKEKPLVTLNCTAIAVGLVESELFGHEKGAFTGALARK
jgi:transcriptional regulator with PAS, ATPase and Fis domain